MARWPLAGLRWAGYCLFVFLVGPAIMVFAAVLIDSGMSFTNLAAEYYDGLALASAHPAPAGSLQVMTCPGNSGLSATIQTCDAPGMMPVSVTSLTLTLANRLRAIYLFSVALSSVVLIAVRSCIRTYARVADSQNCPPRYSAQEVWARAFEAELQSGGRSLDQGRRAIRASQPESEDGNSELLNGQAEPRNS